MPVTTACSYRFDMTIDALVARESCESRPTLSILHIASVMDASRILDGPAHAHTQSVSWATFSLRLPDGDLKLKKSIFVYFITCLYSH